MLYKATAKVHHNNGNRSVVMSDFCAEIFVQNNDGTVDYIYVPDRFTMGVVFDAKTSKAYIYNNYELTVESDYSKVYHFLDGEPELLVFLYYGV